MIRPITFALLAVAGLVTPSCCGAPQFPVIWANEELTATEVLAKFGTRPPTISRTTSVGALLADSELEGLSTDTGLLAKLKELPTSTQARLLVWETWCRWQRDEVFVGLFDPTTGRVISTRRDLLLFLRRRIS
jgi:hypothetical protein